MPLTPDPTFGQTPAGTPPPGAKPPRANQVEISDERTRTYWANPIRRALVRALPAGASRALARLHWLTEDGFPEVYVVLSRYADAAGQKWLRIRVPMRPNGTIGWVPAQALGALHRVTTRLVIDRAALRITLFDHGRRVFSTSVGIGKASTPTPSGNFWIREKLSGLGGSPIYGPYAMGTSDYSVLSDWPGGGVVGIHGTNQPQLIPGRPSHGCVRLHNAAITRMYHLVPIGTPLTIR